MRHTAPRVSRAHADTHTQTHTHTTAVPLNTVTNKYILRFKNCFFGPDAKSIRLGSQCAGGTLTCAISYLRIIRGRRGQQGQIK